MDTCAKESSVETGKVWASCRMTKQQACSRTGPRLRLADSTAFSWIVQETSLIAHDILRERNACLLTPNVSFETTGTGEAMRGVHGLGFRAWCDVSAFGSEKGPTKVYHEQ